MLTPFLSEGLNNIWGRKINNPCQGIILKWGNFIDKSHTMSLPWGSNSFCFIFTPMPLAYNYYLVELLVGEGNGKPLQCPCLENPRDRRAWWSVGSHRVRHDWRDLAAAAAAAELLVGCRLYHLKGLKNSNFIKWVRSSLYHNKSIGYKIIFIKKMHSCLLLHFTISRSISA